METEAGFRISTVVEETWPEAGVDLPLSEEAFHVSFFPKPGKAHHHGVRAAARFQISETDELAIILKRCFSCIRNGEDDIHEMKSNLIYKGIVPPTVREKRNIE